MSDLWQGADHLRRILGRTPCLRAYPTVEIAKLPV